MNILFDISHPAHFHLFKNAIRELRDRDHDILLTIRDKDILRALLDHENLTYHTISSAKQGYAGLFFELLTRNIKMFRLSRRFKPDLLVGTSVSITHVGCLLRRMSLVFNEDDDAVVPLFSYLAYPFADNIVNPECLEYRNWSDKRVLHNSCHELAYLHPDNFRPDPEILKKYGLRERQYVIGRFSALQAHHDVGARGISKDTWNQIENVLGRYTVVRSIENSETHTIEPWDMHHVLAFAKMLISDSQTMTIEAAVLGVPAVRINTFVGKSTVIDELEKKYQLAFGFVPEQADQAIETIRYLLDDHDTENIWNERRKILLSEKVDMNKWMIDFFERGFL